MFRLVVCLGTCLAVLLLGCSAPQAVPTPQPTTYRIGFLGSGTAQPWHQELVDGLHDLGYTEGQNLVIERRFAEGQTSRLPELGTELLNDNVALVLTTDGASTSAMMKLTKTTPIIFAVDSDPVGDGAVQSLNHPGGNVTGLTSLSETLTLKWFQILQDITPGLTRVAILWNPVASPRANAWDLTEATASRLGIQVQRVAATGADDIPAGFQAMVDQDAQGMIVWGDPALATQRDMITQLAAQDQLPAVYERTEFVDAGGLIGYGVSLGGLYRSSAAFVDRVLKGANPGDLPIEQPTRFELVVNTQAADALGLAIPERYLLDADRVVR